MKSVRAIGNPKMRRFLAVSILIGGCAFVANGRSSQAEEPSCIYSGAEASFAWGSMDSPVRYDIDDDGHGLGFIHNVDKNNDPNGPFKPPSFSERRTCSLKLDCVVSTEGLKSIGVQTSNTMDTERTWIGYSVAFKYEDGARNVTCHIVDLKPLLPRAAPE